MAEAATRQSNSDEMYMEEMTQKFIRFSYGSAFNDSAKTIVLETTDKIMFKTLS